MPSPSATSELLCVGDVSLDLTMAIAHLPAPDEKVHAERTVEAPGGVVANAAVAAAKAGASVRLMIRTGNDLASQITLAALRAVGVAVEHESVQGSLCRCVILIEPHGEKRLALEPGVSMFPGEAAIERLSLEAVGHVHTALYGEAAHRLVARCRQAGIGWSVDLEPATIAAGLDPIRDIIAGADTLFVNDRAARALGENAEALLIGHGAKSLIRTLGAGGARYHDAARSFICRPPSGLPIVDTTGAGDCLAGWYAAGRAAGRAPEDILPRAVAAASLSCGSLGAQASYPDKAMLHSQHAKVELIP
ncbi:MAG: carbohydrate kinase family protein [Fulvimarina manganoxydans]|uniref:carbohydrate kinase family protein n=1 Tax=Fulvimarina manganoxydans TaxID=937218 RepID=UPI002354E36C|nr:carbohydrate kinase family protein [Fulvimarina manganoxydans]MCK5932958.1 carbohydrate kinase family protein [Fulvimarina manganoxydans]